MIWIWFQGFAPALSAQAIEGVVLDLETGIPLQGANILQTGTTNGTFTSENGEFELQLLESGLNRVTISHIGYRSREVSIPQTDIPLTIYLAEDPILSGEIFVQSLRVDDTIPVAFTNLSSEEISRNNLGQDLPYLVSGTPSVIATSDAGAGVGYTGIRIRGVDPARINVTINGIPLNDSESHGVFWVNTPDLASSLENIQIQRGVGTSTHGAGAFGATMNLQTGLMKSDPYGEVTSTIGSYNTQRFNVNLGSGRLDNGWQMEGRLSKIDSDGYIDRAASELRSFYLSASREGERSLLKADIFSGQERTYQAWNGVPEPILTDDADELEEYISALWIGQEQADRMRDHLGNRRFNEFTYDNQVDNYQQDHYQLHYSLQPIEQLILNTSLHYTYGRGYFEEYRRQDNLSSYGIDPVEVGTETITSSDLIRRRWLDNHFYGAIFSADYHDSNWNLTLGGGYNEYDGDHFGEVIWARFAGESEHEDRYYDNNGFKSDFNIYGKANAYLTDRLNTWVDLQYRNVNYRFVGLRLQDINGGQEIVDLEQEVRLHFFNPKAGIVWRPTEEQRLFASVSMGSKEPTRRDYIESSPESRPDPEYLIDYEAGWFGRFGQADLGVNLYYMNYRNQLILTGAVNDVGAYVRENVSESYRRGIELQGSAEVVSGLTFDANATFSQNRIPEYTHYLDAYDDQFNVLDQAEEAFTDTDIAFSPSIIANAAVHYDLRSFQASLSTQYVSRQYLDNTQTENRSIDPWFIQNLRLSWSSPLNRVGTLSASLQVNNLLNRKYVSNGYTFGWVENGAPLHFNYYYPQAGRNLLIQVQLGF